MVSYLFLLYSSIILLNLEPLIKMWLLNSVVLRNNICSAIPHLWCVSCTFFHFSWSWTQYWEVAKRNWCLLPTSLVRSGLLLNSKERPATYELQGSFGPSKMLSHIYTTSSHSSLEIKQSCFFVVLNSPYVEAPICNLPFASLLSDCFPILPFLSWENQGWAINAEVYNGFTWFTCHLC